jgi:uncharacterized repeat protein (TIGR03837 family)
MTPAPALHADIFCAVVDNFGDAGIAFNLARHLHDDHHWSVRLIIDHPETLRAINPSYNPALKTQTIDGVHVVHDTGTIMPDGAVDMVIECLAGRAPHDFLATCAEQTPPPVIFAYEYLSAEKWVEEFHEKPSPHPDARLRRYFFYPGFNAHTGGLLAPANYTTRRNEFLNDAAAQTQFWQSLNVPPPTIHEQRITLFTYEQPHIDSWLQHLADQPHPTTLLVPVGRVLPDIARFFGAPQPLVAGDHLTSGNLTARILPFMGRADFDKLLWISDINIVRGEDSLTAAVLSAKPLIWNIYPQENDAHLVKLAAFFNQFWPENPDYLALMQAWNAPHDRVTPWQNMRANLQNWRQKAKNFADAASHHGTAAKKLVDFYQKVR